MSDQGIEAFFAYARERHSIYLRRHYLKQPPHWTQDEVLRHNRFCNVFRELDKTTAWFMDNIREPLRNKPESLLATVAFRWFNRIDTGRVLLDPAIGLMKGKLNIEEARRRLHFQLAPGPYVTGSYIIKTPDGMDKLNGVLWCIEQFQSDAWRVQSDWYNGAYRTLQDMHKRLTEFPFLGDFMAYEIVTDLRHTFWLDEAADINTWANPGPGCARGYCRVVEQPVDSLNRSSQKDRAVLIAGMQSLLNYSRDETLWPAKWPKWEMREVEHTLCEFDKYERVRLGEGKMKQKYIPGA